MTLREDDYHGHKSYGNVLICEFCEAKATHKGAGMVNNHRRFYNLCSACGPQALKDWVINALEELHSFKQWKKERKLEAMAKHPSKPEVSLFGDEK